MVLWPERGPWHSDPWTHVSGFPAHQDDTSWKGNSTFGFSRRTTRVSGPPWALSGGEEVRRSVRPHRSPAFLKTTVMTANYAAICGGGLCYVDTCSLTRRKKLYSQQRILYKMTNPIALPCPWYKCKTLWMYSKGLHENLQVLPAPH